MTEDEISYQVRIIINEITEEYAPFISWIEKIIHKALVENLDPETYTSITVRSERLDK